MTQILLSNGAPVPLPSSPIQFSLLTHSHALAVALIQHVYMRTCGVGWLVNSYAVPKEVGKVGVQSPTFIEPVQKRKDGIEAMFSRQANAARQQKSASRDTPPVVVAAAGIGKRKRESSSPTEDKEEEKETGTLVSTTAPALPARRSKVKKEDPIKHDDAIDFEEGNSDVEILPSGPPSSQSQLVGHPHLSALHSTILRMRWLVFWPTFRKRIMKHVDRRLPSQRRRKRKREMTSLSLLHLRDHSSRSRSRK